MPSLKNTTRVEPDKYYHIFNRGINREKIFANNRHYYLFLKLYVSYLTPFVDTLAYSLLPNHYHFLIRVKNESEFPYPSNASEQFRIMFSQYVQMFNYFTFRKGNLFCKNFKRLEVNNTDYCKRLVFYIQHNPEKHKYVGDFKKYSFSSYQEMISRKSNMLSFNLLDAIFNDPGEILEFHDYLHNEAVLKKLTLEYET